MEKKWFDKWSQSCNLFYKSPKKYDFQFLNERSVRNKVYLITQLMIDYNCSISAITDIPTWLTTDNSALASQLTPDVFKVLYMYLLLVNKYTPHRRGGLALLFSSELKIISSSTLCFSSYEIMIYNIQFPSLFTIIIILIYLPPSYSLWSFLAGIYVVYILTYRYIFYLRIFHIS